MPDPDWISPDIRRLAEYAKAYIKEFNSIKGRLAQLGPPASMYSDGLTNAGILLASDGVLILYNLEKPKQSAGSVIPNVGVHDVRDRLLTRFTQTITYNLLKVWSIALDSPDVFTPPAMPPDLPIEEMVGGMNYDLLKHSIETNAPIQPIGMAISPNFEVRNGKRVGILATRYRVWSPVLYLAPDNRPFLQYPFPFADVIWKHEQLNLGAAEGREYPRFDVETLLLGIRAGLPQKELATDPFEAVARHCERACSALRALIENPNTKEEDVQRFLEIAGNQFLLSPHAREVIPHKPLFGYKNIPDFTIQRPDADYHFVELESPNTVIYQAKGEEPTAAFGHAIQQVEDWLRYIAHNLLTVRNEDKMPTLDSPTGEVVIGLDKHLGEIAKVRFDYKRNESKQIVLRTYDMMVESGLAYAESVRRLKGPPQ
jgi:hypothetical protein